MRVHAILAVLAAPHLALACAGPGASARPAAPAAAWEVTFASAASPADAPADESGFAYIERMARASGIGRRFLVVEGAPRQADDGARLSTFAVKPHGGGLHTSLQELVDFLVCLEEGTARPFWVSRVGLRAGDDGRWKPSIELSAYDVPGHAEGPSAVALLQHVVTLLSAERAGLDDLELRRLELEPDGRHPRLELEGSIATAEAYERLVAALAASPCLHDPRSGPLTLDDEGCTFSEIRFAVDGQHLDDA